MVKVIIVGYYKMKGRIKKAVEFYKLWREWVRIFDNLVDEKMNQRYEKQV